MYWEIIVERVTVRITFGMETVSPFESKNRVGSRSLESDPLYPLVSLFDADRAFLAQFQDHSLSHVIVPYLFSISLAFHRVRELA
jgi:hypothetical protein